MDSNMGSQDQETIAKYLEDSVEISETKENNGMLQRVNGNMDVYQSQPNNEICILKNADASALVDRGLSKSIKGGIDLTHNNKKRGFEDLQVHSNSNQMHHVDSYLTQIARSATSRESFKYKRQRLDQTDKLIKQKSHIEKQSQKLIIEKDFEESFKIPCNESQKEAMDHPMEVQKIQHDEQVTENNSDQVKYELEYVRETNQGGASSFHNLLQDFAKVKITDNQLGQDKHEQIENNQDQIQQVKFQINIENRTKLVNQQEKFVRNENFKQMLKVTDLLVTNNQNKSKNAQDYTFEIVDVNKLDSYQDSYDEDDLLKIIQIFQPKKHKIGTKQNQKFHCNQQMFRRVKPDGDVSILWVLHNVGAENFLNNSDPDFIKHYIESGLFQSHDGCMWKVRFQPGDWPTLTQKTTRSKICLFAVPNPKERDQGSKPVRQVTVKFGIISSTSNKVQNLKQWCLDNQVVFPMYKLK